MKVTVNAKVIIEAADTIPLQPNEIALMVEKELNEKQVIEIDGGHCDRPSVGIRFHFFDLENPHET